MVNLNSARSVTSTLAFVFHQLLEKNIIENVIKVLFQDMKSNDIEHLQGASIKKSGQDGKLSTFSNLEFYICKGQPFQYFF